MLFVCYTCRIRCDFTCKLCSDSIFCMFFTLIFGDIFFTFLILANCVRDESSADSSNGSEECGTYRFLCTQMKILQLLEFGYTLSFFAEAWQKGFVSKIYSQAANFPFFNGCVYYKKNVCIPIIYPTYVESTLSIIICRYRIRDFARRANFLYAHALKWTVSRWPHYFNARANQESLWKFKNRSRTHYVHEKTLK